MYCITKALVIIFLLKFNDDVITSAENHFIKTPEFKVMCKYSVNDFICPINSIYGEGNDLNCDYYNNNMLHIDARLEAIQKKRIVSSCCPSFKLCQRKCVPLIFDCDDVEERCDDGEWGKDCDHECYCREYETCESTYGTCILNSYKYEIYLQGQCNASAIEYRHACSQVATQSFKTSFYYSLFLIFIVCVITSFVLTLRCLDNGTAATTTTTTTEPDIEMNVMPPIKTPPNSLRIKRSEPQPPPPSFEELNHVFCTKDNKKYHLVE